MFDLVNSIIEGNIKSLQEEIGEKEIIIGDSIEETSSNEEVVSAEEDIELSEAEKSLINLLDEFDTINFNEEDPIEGGDDEGIPGQLTDVSSDEDDQEADEDVYGEMDDELEVAYESFNRDLNTVLEREEEELYQDGLQEDILREFMNNTIRPILQYSGLYDKQVNESTLTVPFIVFEIVNVMQEAAKLRLHKMYNVKGLNESTLNCDHLMKTIVSELNEMKADPDKDLSENVIDANTKIANNLISTLFESYGIEDDELKLDLVEISQLVALVHGDNIIPDLLEASEFIVDNLFESRVNGTESLAEIVDDIIKTNSHGQISEITDFDHENSIWLEADSETVGPIFNAIIADKSKLTENIMEIYNLNEAGIKDRISKIKDRIAGAGSAVKNYATNKISNIGAGVRNASKSNVIRGTAGVIGLTAIVAAAIMAFRNKRIKHCVGLKGRQKHQCLAQACDSAIIALRGQKQGCSEHPKPDKCRRKIDKTIAIWTKRKDKYLKKSMVKDS